MKKVPHKKTITPYKILQIKKKLAELNEFLETEHAKKRAEKFRESENRREVSGYYKRAGKLSERNAIDKQRKAKYRAYQAAYRAAHREELREYMKKYQAEHRKEHAERERERRKLPRLERKRKKLINKLNAAERQANYRAYRATHREEQRAYQKAYRAAHREEINARRRELYAIKSAEREQAKGGNV